VYVYQSASRPSYPARGVTYPSVKLEIELSLPSRERLAAIGIPAEIVEKVDWGAHFDVWYIRAGLAE
jgi:hypothetical protein